MTTRANAYAYIRGIKKIPNLSGSRSFLRPLPRDASPIASLLRLRRDVHTTRRPSTAVTIRDNNAAVGNTIQSKIRIGKISNLCPGIRGFSTPVKAKPIADASLFDEPAQKDETISPGEKSIVLPEDGAYLGDDAESRDDTLIKGEYFIFSMLISEKFPDRLEITYNQQEEKSPWECSISFSFNEGNTISATGIANMKVGFRSPDSLVHDFLTFLRTKSTKQQEKLSWSFTQKLDLVLFGENYNPIPWLDKYWKPCFLS